MPSVPRRLPNGDIVAPLSARSDEDDDGQATVELIPEDEQYAHWDARLAPAPETLARILPPDWTGPTGHEFADALRSARTGRIATEWLFDDAVLAALEAVAVDPSDETVAAAREAWRVSGH